MCFYKQLFVDSHVFKSDMGTNRKKISFLNLQEWLWPVPLWPQKQSSKQELERLIGIRSDILS